MDAVGMQSAPDITAVYIYENRSDEAVSVELYNVYHPEKPPVLELEFSIDPVKSYTLKTMGRSSKNHSTIR